MVEIYAAVVVLAFQKNDVIKLLRGKRISNIFRFRGRRTLNLDQNLFQKKIFFNLN